MQTKTTLKNSLTPLLYFIRPYPWHVAGLILLIITEAFFEGVNIVALFGLLSVALGNSVSGEFSSGHMEQFIRQLLTFFPVENKLALAFFIFIAMVALKCLFDFLRRYFTCSVSAKIWHSVQYMIFQKCLYADYQFFVDAKEGEIIYRAFTAPVTMGITLQYICEFVAELVRLAIILFVLFAISFKLSVIVVIFAGLFYLMTHVIAQKTAYYLGKERQEASIRQTTIISELINGIKQVKVYVAQKSWLAEYDQYMCRYFSHYVKGEAWQYFPASILELLAVGVLALSFLFFGHGAAGGIPAGYFSVIGVYVYSFYRFLPSLKNLSAKKMNYSGNLAVIEHLHDFCRKNIATIPDGDKSIGTFQDAIEFKRVGFSYPAREGVLKDISFRVEKGKTTAIVGKSGSGKTTVVNLILRMFLAGQGEIAIDGTDIRRIKTETWLKKIGYVSQETFMFNASIRDNIVFGRPDDEARLLAASRLANAHQFITELPEGYQTPMGDKGMKLSGGQRQRVAIARAMYADPEVVIFDEATSSLDNISEVMIQNALKAIASSHTVIVVAHRLSTVINADKIVVMDSGRVIEQGTHSQLMAGHGHYWQLYNKEA